MYQARLKVPNSIALTQEFEAFLGFYRCSNRKLKSRNGLSEVAPFVAPRRGFELGRGLRPVFRLARRAPRLGLCVGPCQEAFFRKTRDGKPVTGFSRTVYTSIVYTEVVLDKIEGFDWDNANVGHILRHDVTPFEVEEVTGGKYVVIPAKTIKRERRWKLFSKTASGRYLVVVFTIRRKLFRTVTAYEMNATERSKYAPQID